MKRILSEYTFSEEQLNKISLLAADCNLLVDTVKILYSRGIRDKESILNFLTPCKAHFISPFKMSGMDKTVELLARAKEEEWSVVVYGDYDADGICAATIMYKSLLEFGIQANVCVPERKYGYGLSVARIDEIFEEWCPQLIITVDCGISCAEEVEYIKEQGAEVIVTDHHELPDRIPDCICVNPKFRDDYIYDNLCGAGVAFKVGCALNGSKAYKLLDFVAIATVADSVPLTGENRDLVAEGLKLINSNPRKCYADFFSKSEDKIDAQSISFAIAPKINAAGRMGDAMSALELFTTDDLVTVSRLSNKLIEYNLERQQMCDELYLRAKALLKETGTDGRILMLWDENWNAGFVGIVAARLADEYSRPVILFIKNGDSLRGSARSVENVNIFEALKACSAYIEEFGGHSQAAGVNVKLDNFENLKTAMNNYLTENYSAEDFIPTIFTNGTYTGEYTARLVRELQLLEPYGVGNKRPLFEVEESGLSVHPLKLNSPHLSFKCENLDMMYFSGARFSRVLESRVPKKIVFEYNLSSFRGREYIKGFVREVCYEPRSIKYAAEDIAVNGVSNLTASKVRCNITYSDGAEIEKIALSRGDYGTLFIASDIGAVQKFDCLKDLPVDIFVPSEKNLQSSVLISPDINADVSGYKNIIYLDDPVKITNLSLEDKNIIVYSEKPVPAYLSRINVSREALLKIYAALVSNRSEISAASPEELAAGDNFGFGRVQTYFTLLVFLELGLISFGEGRFTVIRGQKTDLSNSELYRTVKEICNG